jgi:drug/metabolite transporter (DMT)-like permease
MGVVFGGEPLSPKLTIGALLTVGAVVLLTSR